MSNNLRKRLKRGWPSDLTYTDKRVPAQPQTRYNARGKSVCKQQSEKETAEKKIIRLDT